MLNMRTLLLLLWASFVVGGAVLSTPYDSIFSFGDSLSDTGNFIRSSSLTFNPVIGKLPYGETFFRKATGRCSNGRLVLDFLAEALGLPYVAPYLSRDAVKGLNFRHGVNFAVAGATALEPNFFYSRNISIMWTNDSLSVQLGWFKKLKSSLCATKQGCDRHFQNSLFVVGEIGGNDYNYAFFVGGKLNEVRAMIPLVVETVAGAVSTLIEEGASKLMVPGNFPFGCTATFLTLFPSLNKEAYDERNGCLRAFNGLAKTHNAQLKQALERLRQKYPHAKIIYADNYGAAMPLYHKPQHFGFRNGALRACCGGGGPYNYNYTARCGHIGSKACDDPTTHANWDGMHLTEDAYHHIATHLIHGPFTSPPLNI